ncbi:MAG: glycoside hydrolase family 30 beta sandwich domain-containing protein [bacterium]
MARVAQRAARRAVLAVITGVAGACGSSGGPSGDVPTTPPPVTPTGAPVQVWLTTGDRVKLLSHESDTHLGADSATSNPVISVDTATTYQRMVGFGAAFTDASVYLIQEKMSAAQRDGLLQDLFGRSNGPAGIGLSFARVTMGASDFSLRQYSYDDVQPGQSDSALTLFSIAPDRADKIPVIKAALAVNPQLTLVASPWSPPAWMKTSGSLMTGTLKTTAYASFADYFVKFIQAYSAEGISFQAVTIQNEPAYEPPNYPGMRLDPPVRAAVIGGYVGPAFAKANITTQIWDWDHNWDVPQSPTIVLNDATARPYIQGIAWHCYGGDVSAQSTVHDAFPDKDVYSTECSGGDWSPDFATNLKYFVGTLVIGATRNWARGVALWNLALDEADGPHTGGCGNCRGVVTVTSSSGVVTRNVEYYALAHASKFVRPGAVRIASTSDLVGLQSVAFRNSDDASKVLVVLNNAVLPRTFVVRAGGKAFTYLLPAGSVATFVWA